jgi:hypothetical protein
MLYGGMHPPSGASVGDYWYCYADRTTYECNSSTAVSNATQTAGYTQLTWVPVPPASYASATPPAPRPGIWINTNDVYEIPHVYSHSSQRWIPIVDLSSGFVFPPGNPKVGDMWHNAATGDDYTFQGSATTYGQGWVLTGGVASGSLSGGFAAVAAPQAAVVIPAQSAQSPPSPILTIYNQNDVLVQIDNNGQITYGPSYTPDLAALSFWTAISAHFPQEFRDVEKYRRENEVLYNLALEYERNIIDLEERIQYAENRGFKFPKPEEPVDPDKAWEAAMGIIQ